MVAWHQILSMPPTLEHCFGDFHVKNRAFQVSEFSPNLTESYRIWRDWDWPNGLNLGLWQHFASGWIRPFQRVNHPKAGKHGGWWHSAERRAMPEASWCRQLERPNPCTGKIYIHGKDVKGGLGQLASTGIQSLSSQLSSCMFMLRLGLVIDVVTTSFIFRKIARTLALTVSLFL